jgi:ribosomal-protein-alanine N-acetyltransferase
VAQALCRYLGRDDEGGTLRKLSEAWNFWRFPDIVRTLQRPDCSLYYLLNPSDPKRWSGLVFLSINGLFAEVLYIYVDPEFRNQGIGTDLFSKLVRIVFDDHKTENLFLEVRVSNIGAQKLYEKFGMKKSKVKRSYYSDGEDALVYQLVNDWSAKSR